LPSINIFRETSTTSALPFIPSTAFSIAERFVGVREVPGTKHHPLILAMLQLDDSWPVADEVPWCSAFVNFIAWLIRLPRSKSLTARSWLTVGKSIGLADARVGFDVVILRNMAGAPGPEVLDAPGHVGLYAGQEGGGIMVLGGNQSDSVSVARFASDRLIGIRRLI
jgi:uncharacterized protein (TIGR02594 family)